MSAYNDLADCFKDTVNQYTTNEELRELTSCMTINTFVHERNMDDGCRVIRCCDMPELIVEENTTFAAAYKHRIYKNRSGENVVARVAVLNFANPHNPGGGVVNGAMAQEECLCRSSNLYAALTTNKAIENYYNYNRNLEGLTFSDRIIYSKGVTVFKNDEYFPKQLPQAQWFQVDVITCAAPFNKNQIINESELMKILIKRIHTIFSAAYYHGAQVLVLGAFGCGAFGNPPEIVAKAFHEVWRGYKKDFIKIVFAIKSSTSSAKLCPNIIAFKKEFQNDMCDIKNIYYKEWEYEKNIYGKKFSIFGDSISTLTDYNPEGYSVFFDKEKCRMAGIYGKSDTWWGKVIDFFDGELVVNNSWSGSRVAKLPNMEELFPSGCSEERTSSLHIGKEHFYNRKKIPDIIIIYLGTNDWGFGTKIEDENLPYPKSDYSLFGNAYERMLELIHKNYPKSEIWCCSLMPTFMSEKSDFKFPYCYAGTHIEQYNQVIAGKAALCLKKYKCKLRYLDLYRYSLPYDTIDGSHPNRAGMNIIAMLILREICKISGDEYLDCKDEMHEYKYIKKELSDTIYVCKKCGKIIRV